MKSSHRDRLAFGVALGSMALLVVLALAALLVPSEASRAHPHPERAGLLQAASATSPALAVLARLFGSGLLALLFALLFFASAARRSRHLLMVAALITVGVLQLCFTGIPGQERLGLLGVWLLPLVTLLVRAPRAASARAGEDATP